MIGTAARPARSSGLGLTATTTVLRSATASVMTAGSKHREACIRIPMWGDIRSLNLSNAVAVILYEALRQQDFATLEKQGALHRLHWETEEEY